MATYLVRRLLQSIPLLFLVALIAFLLIHAAPGGPGETLLHPGSTEASLAQYRANLGLGRPLSVQFLDWIGLLIQGNFGYSFTTGLPVLAVIGQKLPITLLLMGSSLLLTLAVAVPLGVLSAVRRYSLLDSIGTVFTFIGISIPDFWLGFMLILVFAVDLRVLPAGGVETIGAPFSLPDLLRHLLLPAVVLAFVNMAAYARYIRSSMLDVIRQDYIRTARAKGLRERAVTYRHAFRNAMIPVLTIAGLNVLPMLFSGAVVIETVFDWPGMGLLFYSSLNARDYPVCLGIAVLVSVFVILGNLLADVLYAVVDPRITYA